MYDDKCYTVDLTSDEYDLIVDALERAQDHAVGVAETITIETLLEKLDGLN